jgi:hypothetical protein
MPTLSLRYHSFSGGDDGDEDDDDDHSTRQAPVVVSRRIMKMSVAGTRRRGTRGFFHFWNDFAHYESKTPRLALKIPLYVYVYPCNGSAWFSPTS